MRSSGSRPAGAPELRSTWVAALTTASPSADGLDGGTHRAPSASLGGSDDTTRTAAPRGTTMRPQGTSRVSSAATLPTSTRRTDPNPLEPNDKAICNSSTDRDVARRGLAGASQRLLRTSLHRAPPPHAPPSPRDFSRSTSVPYRRAPVRPARQQRSRAVAAPEARASSAAALIASAASTPRVDADADAPRTRVFALAQSSRRDRHRAGRGVENLTRQATVGGVAWLPITCGAMTMRSASTSSVSS